MQLLVTISQGQESPTEDPIRMSSLRSSDGQRIYVHAYPHYEYKDVTQMDPGGNAVFMV